MNFIIFKFKFFKFTFSYFTVFSFSLDKDANRWKAAISKDKLTWEYHASDLKGWSSEGSKLYGVSSIPMNYLIDDEGNILAKNLRGQALEEALEKYVKYFYSKSNKKLS
mgnify:CR=1 FL=1